jgi:hypothetical protein
MFERMHSKGDLLSLPVVAAISVVAGLLLSGFVLSVSPALGFGVILLTGVVVVAAIEVAARLRWRRDHAHDPGHSPLRMGSGLRGKRPHREDPDRDLVETEVELIHESWLQ